MRSAVVVAVFISIASPSLADDSPLQIAITLGEVVGSEKLCNIEIDQVGLSRYIEAHVPADDLSFNGTMANIARTTPRDYEEMTQSMKTAHCVQMRRIADALGIAKK